MIMRILYAIAFIICNSAYTHGFIDGWTLIYSGIILGAIIIRD